MEVSCSVKFTIISKHKAYNVIIKLEIQKEKKIPRNRNNEGREIKNNGIERQSQRVMNTQQKKMDFVIFSFFVRSTK